MSIKGYKVFNPDWTCRGFQYELGKTYLHEGEIDVCCAGFHFCEKAVNCFNYYNFNSDNKVAEIEAIGNIKTEGDKSVTDKIKIIRELNWHEVLDLVNTSKNCTGRYNIGDYNSGDYNVGCWNTGDCNTGNYNTGNCNTGKCNAGYHNTGYHNTGYYNTGYFNVGSWNTGDKNTGDWNSCDRSTGFFNSISQPVYAFNKLLNIDILDFVQCDGIRILNSKYSNNVWITANNMTAEEKKAHPEYEYTDGYLKTVDFKTACKIMWKNISYSERQAVKEIPNFDAEVFKEITGIDVEGE